jgi:hypothetical protein
MDGGRTTQAVVARCELADLVLLLEKWKKDMNLWWVPGPRERHAG